MSSTGHGKTTANVEVTITWKNPVKYFGDRPKDTSLEPIRFVFGHAFVIVALTY